MLRLVPISAAALAACTPSPQENAMHSRTPDAGTTGGIASANRASQSNQAAQGSTPEASPLANHPLPGLPADSPAQAEGRRTLSAAFVRVGPDGYLTVELRDGRVLVLRNVAMRRKDYCGEQVPGGKYCGGYADVAAARPGGGPGQPDPAATDAGPLPAAPPKAK